MAQFSLGQKVKLVAKPADHCPWPVGTTGEIGCQPGNWYESKLHRFLDKTSSKYVVIPDTPSSTCNCDVLIAPASCLAPVTYDGYDQKTDDTAFDFTTEDELENVTCSTTTAG